MASRAWTKVELLKVLALYCQIPFGTMHAKNPKVIELSVRLERTPSAVALKLVNFASFDPLLQRRGVGGMANSSRADREVWAEYSGRWQDLAELDYDEAIRSPELGPEPCPTPDFPEGPTDRVILGKSRLHQDFFRNAVLAAYNYECCITGIACESLLRASHIVPWALDSRLRLDPRNGLCLNVLHDSAFDRGLVGLSDDLELLISTRLEREIPTNHFKALFADYSGKVIRKPERFEPLRDALEFHRREVFTP